MKKERIKAHVSDLVLNEGQISWLPKNPRQWTQTDIDKTKQSLERDSDFHEDRPVLVVRYEDKLLVFGGNLRTTAAKALRWKTIDAVCYTHECEEDKEVIKRRAILDNGSFGEWDVMLLADEWRDLPLEDWGVVADWPKEEKDPKPTKEVEIESSFRIEISCASEGEQEMLYAELTGRGLECRILTL
jgi:hypothetical protein